MLYIFFSLLGIWFVLLLNNDVEYTVSSLMKYKRKKKKKSKPQKQVEVREQGTMVLILLITLHYTSLYPEATELRVMGL